MHIHLKAICFSFSWFLLKPPTSNPVIQLLPVVSLTPQRGEPLCNGKEKDQRALHKCNSMALSSRGHSKNRCKPISCACCSLSFISESLGGIRYPLMEGRGAVCQRPVTFWIKLWEVKSTHYQSRSPQKHTGSRLKLAVAFILSASQMEAEAGCWKTVSPRRRNSFYRQISSREMSLPLLFLPLLNHFIHQLMFTPRIWVLSASMH